MTSDKLTHALQYAAMGIRVFPLWPNTKIPALDAWQHKSTTDAHKIRAWWENNPNYNIGVATGNGVIAIDADVKHGRPGLVSLDALDLELLPTTFRAITPSGGSHTLLKVDRAISNRADTIDGYPGIDIRGENGYIVGIGSTTPEGAYTAANQAPIATAPADLYDVLGKRPQHQKHTDNPIVDLDTDANVTKATRWLTTSAPKAIEGEGGDHATFQVAAMLRDFGLSQAVALDLMFEHWNENQEPPWAPEELALKVQNAFTYATGSWGGKTAAADFDTVDDADDIANLDIGTPPTKEAIAQAAGKAPSKALQMRSLKDVNERAKAAPSPYLVKGLFDQGTFSVLYGPPKAAKTFLALDIAGAIAAGVPWQGMRTAQGTVLYFAMEGGGGINRRVEAMRLHRQLDFDAPLFLHAGAIDLRSSKDGADAIIRAARQCAQDANQPTRLIVIDTLARAFGGGNENEGPDMGAFIANIDRIRQFTGATVLVVHHTPKATPDILRGHGSLLGAIDTAFRISEDKQVIVAAQRDLEAIDDLPPFSLVDVEIDGAPDEDGLPPHSAGVAFIDVSEFDDGAMLSEEEHAFLDVFRMLAERADLEGRGGVVTTQEWHVAYLDTLSAGSGEGEGAARSQSKMKRLRQALEAAKAVKRKGRGDYVLGRDA